MTTVSTIRDVMHKKLKMHAYKLQFILKVNIQR